MCHHVLTKMERNTPKYLKSFRFFWRIQVFSYKRRPRYDMNCTHRFSRGLYSVLERINWKVKTKMAFNPCMPSWTPLIGDDAHWLKFPQPSITRSSCCFPQKGKCWNGIVNCFKSDDAQWLNVTRDVFPFLNLASPSQRRQTCPLSSVLWTLNIN